MDKPIVTNAADEIQVEKAGKKLKASLRQRRAMVFKLAQSPEFQLWFWDWAKEAGCLFHSPLGETDRATNVNCGKQLLGNAMFVEIVKADPNFLLNMMANVAKKATAVVEDDIANQDE